MRVFQIFPGGLRDSAEIQIIALRVVDPGSVKGILSVPPALSERILEKNEACSPNQTKAKQPTN